MAQAPNVRLSELLNNITFISKVGLLAVMWALVAVLANLWATGNLVLAPLFLSILLLGLFIMALFGASNIVWGAFQLRARRSAEQGEALLRVGIGLALFGSIALAVNKYSEFLSSLGPVALEAVKGDNYLAVSIMILSLGTAMLTREFIPRVQAESARMFRSLLPQRREEEYSVVVE